MYFNGINLFKALVLEAVKKEATKRYGSKMRVSSNVLVNRNMLSLNVHKIPHGIKTRRVFVGVWTMWLSDAKDIPSVFSDMETAHPDWFSDIN